jgi:hypothetical protein
MIDSQGGENRRFEGLPAVLLEGLPAVRVADLPAVLLEGFPTTNGVCPAE